MVKLSQKKLALLLSTCLLSSCSSMVYKQAKQDASDTTKLTDQLNKKAAQPLTQANMAPIQISSKVYLSVSAHKRESGQILPESVEHNGVRLVSAKPLDLRSIGDLITEATGIPVAFSADVFDVPNADPTAPAAPPKTQTNPAVAPGQVQAIKAVGQNNAPVVFANQSKSSRDTMLVDYKGPLSGFLNMAAAYFDIGWNYTEGRLQFSREITRTFQLAAMPSTMTSSSSMNAGLSGSGGGGSSGGSSGGGSSGGSSSGGGSDSSGLSAGASQNAEVDVSIDFWKDLDKTLKTIIGPSGTFSTSRSQSSITVTAPASTIDRVGREIYALNQQLLRQVTVNVHVYSVKLDNQSSWQYQLNAILGTGYAKVTAGNNATPPTQNKKLGNTAPPPGGYVTTPTSNLSSALQMVVGNSSALLSDLEQNDNVSEVTSAAVTTMSGQPVPLQVSNTRGYVASVSNVTTDEGTTTATDTETVNTGFSLNVLPKVMDDGKVLLQYSVNISSLAGQSNGFDIFSTGGRNPTTVQLPNVDQRSFIQESLINNGATLVLAGFETVNDTAGDTGLGNADFKALGGGRASEKERQLIVICITPIVLDHSAELGSYK